ncbi:MAG TPA: VOC family protein [Vitreimonas sp.]|nr:VOC family protein [Vitreimonas sp.]
MKMVPLFRCDDLAAALKFYTEVLDFQIEPDGSADDFVVSVVRDDVELMLTRLAEQKEATAAHLIVDDVDALFAAWMRRGLDQSHRTESPVHLGPVDQTWGTRELYVTDPCGNTLRIVQRK